MFIFREMFKCPFVTVMYSNCNYDSNILHPCCSKQYKFLYKLTIICLDFTLIVTIILFRHLELFQQMVSPGTNLH